jgi:hypothetical protein
MARERYQRIRGGDNARPPDLEHLLSDGREFVHDTRNRLAIVLTVLAHTAQQPTLPPDLRHSIDRALAEVRGLAQDVDLYNAFLRSFDEDAP